MQYDFRCQECGHVQTVQCSVDEFDKTCEAGVGCSECDGDAKFEFNANGVEFQFKGMAWSDKNYREKKYRNRRSSHMAERQRKNVFRPKLKPNYKGEETKSWSEAQDAARDDGKIGLTYEPLIQKEQNQSR